MGTHQAYIRMSVFLLILGVLTRSRKEGLLTSSLLIVI